jgi:aminoacylase
MASQSTAEKDALDTQAVNNFREYLRIPTVHPNINYDACVKFLENQAKSLDLPIKVYHVVPKKPIVIITWTGTEPTLPSILLNSHMDVVPVFEEKWTHKPFAADLDEQNNIYARGSQDVKCVGIQYLEAVRRLKRDGVTLKRTLHISFVPDEETGGVDGMKQFVYTKDFQNLNVGMGLDEGMPSSSEKFAIFNAERNIWHLIIHCPGKPGHGSLLLDNTAGEKVAYLLNKFYNFRKQEQQKLKDNSNLTLADVTTVNLTQMSGGVQTNVIPPEFIITFDCRITPQHDIKKWQETIDQWCKEAGPGVWIEYEQKEDQVTPTKLDNSNPYWLAFKDATDKLGLKVKPVTCPGGTDARFVRMVGIPAIGFSPINNTPLLLHNHDEYLGVDTFLKGIKIYCKILVSIGNVEEKTE